MYPFVRCLHFIYVCINVYIFYDKYLTCSIRQQNIYDKIYVVGIKTYQKTGKTDVTIIVISDDYIKVTEI